ncbi:MAG: translation initiation factor IF-2 [Cytophagales bacterium]|nr:MAG: translation initiation factor IF-2 [Cytophagales bacterium]TAF61213.1 MAG: translation initiation factor IF-2 [Cytophagales bacterium]
MSDNKNDKRLSSVAKELNVGTNTLLEFLVKKVAGFKRDPNAKISSEQYELIVKEFADSKQVKKEASALTIGKSPAGNLTIDTKKTVKNTNDEEEDRELLVKSHADPLKSIKIKDSTANKSHETIKGGLQGPKVVGKIDLDAKNRNSQSINSDSTKKVATETVKPLVSSSDVPKSEPVIEKVQTTEVKSESTPISNTPELKVSSKVAESVEPQKEEKSPVLKVEPKKEASTTLPPKAEDSSKKAPTREQFKPKLHTESKKPAATNIPSKETPLIQSKQETPSTEKAKVASQTPISVSKEPIKTTPLPDTHVKIEGEHDLDDETIKAKANQLQGLRILGKIEIADPKAAKKKKKKKKIARPVASSDAPPANKDVSSTPNLFKASGNHEGNRNTGSLQQVKVQTTNTTSDSNSSDAEKRKKKKKKKKDDGVSLADNISASSLKSLEQSKGTDGKPKFVSNTSGTPPRNFSGGGQNYGRGGGHSHNKGHKPSGQSFSDKDVQQQVKATLAKMSGSANVSRKNFKKEKRTAFERARTEEILKAAEDAKVLKVSEFVSVNELANMMEVSVSTLIAKCLQMGLMVSINQRLEADNIAIIADEFGFSVEFVSADEEINKSLETDEDNPEDLVERAPIVTIMGHVDHGKTTLLDYIRKANVAAGEAGGITQHIGAYSVMTSSGKPITFLDTPGHEAFTAMRARGAKVTDIVIIVVAADDGVMPQTKEAVNHALVAGVPIVVAINKIDKPGANSDRIRQELADLNVLVEEWGGKYQCQEISAKQGLAVDELLEKILIQAEFLDLKANPDKLANGAVIEASLDKGRGYVTTILVQSGTFKVGDIMLAGAHFGRVRAMFDHTGKNIKKAGPSTPVQILGLSGAPQAGDRFNVLATEREAREIATKREQILREQSVRATKRLTLNDIGRRKALGNFHQLKLIVKGDVDGSVEALSDALLKLSNEEVEVQIIHKAVGQISESDVLLASASDAILIGFQVRPSRNARVLADREKIEIRLYSIIYQTIDEVKSAIEGLLAPKVEEVIIGNVVIREVFKISKVGTIAGCYVTDGHIQRKSKVRLIRNGIVLFTGDISSLKRFKDDVNEVKYGFEFGLSLHNFNDLEQNDELEVFETKEVKRTL